MIINAFLRRWRAIPTAALGPRQEALTLVRICVSPAIMKWGLEALDRPATLKKKKILFLSLWPKGEKRALRFDIIKMSFVWRSNLLWPRPDNSLQNEEEQSDSWEDFPPLINYVLKKKKPTLMSSKDSKKMGTPIKIPSLLISLRNATKTKVLLKKKPHSGAGVSHSAKPTSQCVSVPYTQACKLMAGTVKESGDKCVSGWQAILSLKPVKNQRFLNLGVFVGYKFLKKGMLLPGHSSHNFVFFFLVV